MIDQYELEVVGNALDVDYYLSSYADVAGAGVDPTCHFCTAGWREGRNPSATFDTRYYLSENPDVAAANINPFWHYLVAGKDEGRRPNGGKPAIRTKLDAARPPTGETFRQALGNDLSADDIVTDPGRPLLVTVSHDDYAVSVGGVQTVIADEAAAVGDNWCRLHLSPAEPRPTLASPTDAFLRVRLDGTDLGNAPPEAVASVLASCADRQVVWVIHHLMGHAPEVIAQLIAASGSARVFFWAHDYFAACPNPTLLRNDVAFCGAPVVASQGCQICVYGRARPQHQARIARFLDATAPTIVAPSDTALELWAEYCDRPIAGHVRPIATLCLDEPDGDTHAPERIRVGFLGMRQFHKGWHVFTELAAELTNDPRYEFVQIGNAYGDAAATPIPLVEVAVSAENRFAMVEAIARCRVDVVIAWSIWPETFNFTVHEAIAAGAFVIVRRDVGYPATAVKRHAAEQSVDVADDGELIGLFRSGRVLDLVGSATRRRGALVPMGGTADLVMAEVER